MILLIESRTRPKPSMHPKALLQSISELLARLMLFTQPADRVVSEFFREHRALGSRDRHVLAETAYTVLRRRLLLQHLAQSGSGDLRRRLAVLAWQGDESFLHAALDERERVWLEQVRAIDISTLPQKVRLNLPGWLVEPLQSALEHRGGGRIEDFVAAMDEAAPLDLRVNLFKSRRDKVQAALAESGIESQPTPYSPWGLRVRGKPALQKLQSFTSGEVEVQDEGSQLLALILDAHRGEMVVDFCAGAGGKTLALGAAMRNTGRLYAFDTSGHRLAALKPRLARSGLSNVHPVQIAHERDERIKRLAGKIDRVLVDAPCSGLGTLRRNPDLKWRQSPESVKELALLQQAILNSAARLLKPGGRLVYATCSVLEAENEEVAAGFGAAHPEFEVLDLAQELQRLKIERGAELCQGPYLRLWPHRHGADGFFAAAWTRR